MGKNSTGRVIGVDVGGTFTDLVEINGTSGEVRLAKVPSTPDNQAFGVLDALDTADIDPSDVDLIVHGTTTTTHSVRAEFAQHFERGREANPHQKH